MDGVDGTIEYPLASANELAEEAWAAMSRKDAETALRAWRELREHSPERPEGHIWPIQVLWESGRLDEAEALAVESLKRLPDNPELAVQHAWIAAMGEHWDVAVQRWAIARARAPGRREGYVWGVRALWETGRTAEAEALASEALQLFPDDIELLAQSAWAATAQQNWDAALRRWTLLHETHPERIDAQARLIQALRMVGRVADSEALASAALADHPDETEVIVEHIWAAIGREDWKEAVARLDRANGDPRHAQRLRESLGAIEPQMRDMAEQASRPSAAGHVPIPIPTTASDPKDAKLALAFESLGERCDFGAVQRRFGVEPLGLLRFAWTRFDPLVSALEDRFDAAGSEADTRFELYGDETIIWMDKYQLLFHTFVHKVAEEPPEKQEAFRKQQRRRLIFLRDKLIADLEDPQKICVYSTDEANADSDVARLFAALRAYGPNSLLYVRPATSDRPNGMVEKLEDGLYAGYFPGLTDFVAGGQPPFELWRQLCQRTHELVTAGPPPIGRIEG